MISHLSCVSLWLGFHTIGIYVHNDAVTAFGQEVKQILIEPIFVQIVQKFIGKPLYGGSETKGIPVVKEIIGASFMPLGPGDLMVHHAIALGLHVTILILVKGAFNGNGSKIMTHNTIYHEAFPCDGPGRGGTCDI